MRYETVHFLGRLRRIIPKSNPAPESNLQAIRHKHTEAHPSQFRFTLILVEAEVLMLQAASGVASQ